MGLGEGSRRSQSAHSAGFLVLPLASGLAPLGWWLGRVTEMPGLFAWLPIAVVFGIVPILDAVLGRDPIDLDRFHAGRIGRARWYRLFPLACLPLQLVAVTFGAWVFATAAFPWYGQLGWVASCGLVSGIIAINVAHELIHKRARLEQCVGGALVSTVCYGTFPIEHVYGHHVDVGTLNDPVTARFGQSYYAFLANALRANFVKAWRLQEQHLARAGRRLWSPRNPLVWWYGLTASYALGLWVLFGIAGSAFFFLQAFFAVATLEAVNYIEHYGLSRRMADGSFEEVGAQPSWDTNWLFTNLLLINLQRHADHHLYARRPYQVLRHTEQSPQLPAGYGLMIPLALIPPVWRRVMHPRLLAYLDRQKQASWSVRA